MHVVLLFCNQYEILSYYIKIIMGKKNCKKKKKIVRDAIERDANLDWELLSKLYIWKK